MKNLLGRDVWLDIDAVDSENRELDIEVQRADRGAGWKRARYHSSILGAHLLRPGDTFDDLPETYVIFITENDVISIDAFLSRLRFELLFNGLSVDVPVWKSAIFPWLHKTLSAALASCWKSIIRYFISLSS